MKEVVLQSHSDCGVSKVPFTVQPFLVGTALLVVKVDALPLDPFELVYLCAEYVYISYNTGIP